MKVRMRVEITGLRNGSRWPAVGGELVVPDAEGAELCKNGYAEPVAEVAKPEARPAQVEPQKRARGAK